MLESVGRTQDGKTVVTGVYKFYETTGVPLDSILGILEERGMIPDWMAFILEAIEAGMKTDRILSMLEPAIADSYGSGMRIEVIRRLRFLTAPKSV